METTLQIILKIADKVYSWSKTSHLKNYKMHSEWNWSITPKLPGARMNDAACIPGEFAPGGEATVSALPHDAGGSAWGSLNVEI